MHELSSCNGIGTFYTLTYSPEFLPKNEELSIRELQLFIKRLRRSIEPKKIKHFSCGEYGSQANSSVVYHNGSNLGRPHYHGIIFGLFPDKSTENLINDCWRKGYIKIGTVTQESCRYVTDYVLKKYNGEKASQVYGDMQSPFRLMSHGLGKTFVLSDINNFIHNQGFYVRGKHKKLPRYYRDVIYQHLFETQGINAALQFIHDYRRSIMYSSETYTKSLINFFAGKRNVDISIGDFYNIRNNSSLNSKKFKLTHFSKGELHT